MVAIGLLNVESRLFFTKTADISIVGLQVLVTKYRAVNPRRNLTRWILIQGIGEDLFCECHRFRSGSFPLLVTLSRQLDSPRPKWSEEVVPTVGFNVRNVRKGNITLKIWDIAGASWVPASSGSSTLTRHPTQANRNSDRLGNDIAAA